MDPTNRARSEENLHEGELAVVGVSQLKGNCSTA